ncbi:glycerol dehydratase, cobalamin-independent, small subunit [Alkalispirochaeta americana]|uniref:Glycerol dehydratase, cobalamin-independent, small subunit n=1 Tax=Alkalispirochaeta americana TaxID=159291 RepID=A0A1N6QHY1_9SPIO|nr:glycyl-radical enzyme activating protein [Alkalispirochaeta americana]SIQ15976.1 glycerol dehydratase, cobalamin-independent, small subunit [Alkalispirochaeta americana]
MNVPAPNPARNGKRPHQGETGAITGRVFDIKRFALHDGPGIRTTAFLKGCPLACRWCQNPEGIPRTPLLFYHREQCIRCRRCIAVCPEGALSAREDQPDGANPDFITIDRSLCRGCGLCIEACPTRALTWDSSLYTVEELFQELQKDRVFFDTSGGGITLSGGEPLAQPEFVQALLERCLAEGLHTALETTLQTSRAVLERVLPLTKLFLADLKLADSEEHRRFTGVENQQILDNARFLADRKAPILFRLPLIPKTTTSHDNISGIARFVKSLPGNYSLELINFNPLASGKYRMLGQPYPYADYTAPLPETEVEALAALVRAQGVPLG